jgi:glucose-1-phosphate cytidylyltransferase
MKVIILAGGYGTRLSEEPAQTPKPMVEIGGMPLLWHIMKIYSYHGFNDFIVCLGYKGYVIKEFFANYFLHMADITIDLKKNKTEVHQTMSEPWKVTLVDTGQDSGTGGRMKKIETYIGSETFMLTYGDGVSNIDIKELVRFHKTHGKLATITAVTPPGRFGNLRLVEGTKVKSFVEKPQGESAGFNNGGFFVLEPKVFGLIKGDKTMWEKTPLETLAKRGQLQAYIHKGFWQPVDTLREKNYLEHLWASGKAPWKLWK